MPYLPQEFIPAPLFLEHKGLKVFHAYKDDDMANGPREFWFVLDPSEGEEEAFDVRDLDTTLAVFRRENIRPINPLDKPFKHEQFF